MSAYSVEFDSKHYLTKMTVVASSFSEAVSKAQSKLTVELGLKGSRIICIREARNA